MLEVEPLGIVQLTFVVLFCSRWSSKHTQLPPHFGAGIFIVVALTLVPQNVYWMLTSLNLHLNNIQQPLIDATVHVCACNLHPLSTELFSHFIYLFIWASYFPRFLFTFRWIANFIFMIMKWVNDFLWNFSNLFGCIYLVCVIFCQNEKYHIEAEIISPKSIWANGMGIKWEIGFFKWICLVKHDANHFFSSEKDTLEVCF